MDKLKHSATKEVQNKNSKAFFAAFVDPNEHRSLLEIQKCLLRMESSLKIIFQFWIETSKWCGELASNGFTKTSVNLNTLARNWIIYREAIGKAAVSIISSTSQPLLNKIDIFSIKYIVSDNNTYGPVSRLIQGLISPTSVKPSQT